MLEDLAALGAVRGPPAYLAAAAAIIDAEVVLPPPGPGSTGSASLLAVTALAQVREAVLRSSLVSLSTAQAKALGSQEPKSYDYHSNDIIETLKGLLDTFKKQKDELDTEEFQASSEFEKVKLAVRDPVSA